MKIDCILSHCPLHGRQVISPWGAERARIMVVGESPGIEEERRNKPFIGRVGKLLQDAAKSASIPWETLFLTNAVKCRIDSSRISPAEMVQALACCRGYLEYAILSVRPAVIIAYSPSAYAQVAGDQPLPALLGGWTWSETFQCKVLPIVIREDELAFPEIKQQLAAIFQVAGAMAGQEKEKVIL